MEIEPIDWPSLDFAQDCACLPRRSIQLLLHSADFRFGHIPPVTRACTSRYCDMDLENG